MAGDSDAGTSIDCGQPRPCICDNYRIGERYTSDQCRECYLFHCNPLFRKRWSPCGDISITVEDTERLLLKIAELYKKVIPSQNSIPPSANTICEHRSEEIAPSEAVSLGLGTVRKYYRCAAGQTLNRANVIGVVCSCAGCGPTCQRYSTRSGHG